MAYPPAPLAADLLNETDAETGVDDAEALIEEGGTPGEGEHAERHNLSAAAINDIVAELGANPSGAEATVQARMEALGLTLASKADTTAVTEALAAKASKAELASEESARISGLAGKAPTVHEHAQYDPFDALPYVIPMGVWPFTTLTPTVSRAYFLRFTVARKRTFKFVRYAITAVGSGEDKIDSGIYIVNGAKLERLGSTGAVKTTTNATGVKAPEMTSSVVCEPGNIYFVGQTWETVSGSVTTAALNNNGGFYGDIGGTTLANRLQIRRETTFPLPSEVSTGLASTPCIWLCPSES